MPGAERGRGRNGECSTGTDSLWEDEKFCGWTAVMAAQVHLRMVKVVHLTLRVFYHNERQEQKSPEAGGQHTPLKPQDTVHRSPRGRPRDQMANHEDPLEHQGGQASLDTTDAEPTGPAPRGTFTSATFYSFIHPLTHSLIHRDLAAPPPCQTLLRTPGTQHGQESLSWQS